MTGKSANLIFNVKFAEMITRKLEFIVKDALRRNASVAILGPRQVGKTTIAFNISETIPSIYLDLESRLPFSRFRYR